MPHHRKRHAGPVLERLSKMSSLIGLLGHRQVGKTTLLEKLSQNYVTLDDEDSYWTANKDPKEFIASLKTLRTVIDECQLSERLFPALKERVRKDKRPGQFFLSGSVRFTSKKLIRESLTGRIMNAELLPLTLSELDESDLPDLALRILQAKKMQDLRCTILQTKEYSRRMKLIQQYQSSGGLPGICFIRKDKLRAQKIMDQLETILNRDLRQIHETTLALPELLRFVRQLATFDGTSIQHQTLRRSTGISPETQKKLLFALEATFIIRHLPIEGDYHESAIFFEDQAEVQTLSQNQLSEDQKWIGLVYRNLREQFFYRLGENVEFFQYQRRGGVLVPFAVRTPESSLAIIPIQGMPTRATLGPAQSFLRKYTNGKAVLVTPLNETKVIDDRTLLISAAQLLI